MSEKYLSAFFPMLQAVLLFAIFFATLKNLPIRWPCWLAAAAYLGCRRLQPLGAACSLYTLSNLILMVSFHVLFFYIARKKSFH